MNPRRLSARLTSCSPIPAARRTVVEGTGSLPYSASIDHTTMETDMNLSLALRTLAVLALVAAATVLLAGPAPLGGPHPALNALLVLAHH
jgi:hypothetical protein